VPVRVVQGVLSPGPPDLLAIIDACQGDKPLKDLRFRCAKCGSRMTNGEGLRRRAAVAADGVTSENPRYR